jgi:hypothetical protein
MLTRHQWIVAGAVGLGLVLAISFAAVMPRIGHAFTLIERPAWVFSPSSVAPGQNAVLGVINWGDDVAVVQLVIVNAMSTKTILAQKQITLSPGMGQGITFSNSVLNGAVVISGAVAIRQGTNQQDLLANLASSLEIMDASGIGNRLHVAPLLLPAVQLPAVQ